MRGSLDDLPIQIGMDRRGVLAGLAFGALAVAVMWYFGKAGSSIFIFACIATVMCGMLLLTQPYMLVSNTGLAWGNALGKHSWPRSDFDRFEVRQIPVFGITCVGCQFSATHAGGHEGIIGLLWEVPTPELVALLNEARQRWTGLPLAGPAAIE